MKQRAFAGWGFVFAGIVFLIVGAMPVFRGGSPRITYIVLAIAFMLIGAAIGRRARSGNAPPPG